MKTWLRIVLSLALFLEAGCAIALRRDSDQIEASLLKLTPLGSNSEAVLDLVKKKGWRSSGYIEQHGFYKQQGTKNETVGVFCIQASLGDYYAFPLGTTNAMAFWGFDKDRRLIQIWVWKTTDSI